MQIILTGANGFLGKYIFNGLLGQSDIITLGRFGCNINCDLAKCIPSLPNVDLVIHAAGKAHSFPKTLLDKQAFFDVNLKGTKNFLEGIDASRSLPKAFIFISSVAVYGLERGVNVSEYAPLLAQDPYGCSKIKAEKLILDWCKKNNVICTILRLPLVVAPNAPGNLGAMIQGIKKGFYFNIRGLSAQKSMVLASDVTNCLLKVSEIGGIYNLTDGCHPTINQLSFTISQQLNKKFIPGIPLFFAKILAKVGDLLGDRFPINSKKLAKLISPLTFDDSKARNIFGWSPIPVVEGFNLFEKA